MDLHVLPIPIPPPPKQALELKSTTTEMKNSLAGFKGRLGRQKNKLMTLKIVEWTVEIIKAEDQQDKRLKKIRQSLLDNIKRTKILVGDPEEEEKEAERIFEEIMAENFLNLKKDVYVIIQKAQ